MDIYGDIEMKKSIFGIVVLAMMLTLAGCGKKYNSQSIENRDYALNMRVSNSVDGYVFCFEVADLTDYKGDSGRSMKKEKYVYKSEDLLSVLKMYFIENERQLDIGHIDKLELDGGLALFEDLFEELSDMPYFPKSVDVIYDGGKKTVLRKLIAKMG